MKLYSEPLYNNGILGTKEIIWFSDLFQKPHSFNITFIIIFKASFYYTSVLL